MEPSDPNQGFAGYEVRSRRETRPAVTSFIMILLAIPIIIDVLRRRRHAAAPEAVDQDDGGLPAGTPQKLRIGIPRGLIWWPRRGNA